MKLSEVAFSYHYFFSTSARTEPLRSTRSQLSIWQPTHDLMPIHQKHCHGNKGAKYPSLCSLRLWDQSSWPQWKWWAALTSSSTDAALWPWMFPLYELRGTSWAGRTTRGLCRRMLRQDLVLTGHCWLCRCKDNVCQTFRSEYYESCCLERGGRMYSWCLVDWKRCIINIEFLAVQLDSRSIILVELLMDDEYFTGIHGPQRLNPTLVIPWLFL